MLSFTENMSYCRSFYLKVCIIEGHVLLLEMSYWCTCFIGGHILQNDLLYKGTPII